MFENGRPKIWRCWENKGGMFHSSWDWMLWWSQISKGWISLHQVHRPLFHHNFDLQHSTGISGHWPILFGPDRHCSWKAPNSRWSWHLVDCRYCTAGQWWIDSGRRFKLGSVYVNCLNPSFFFYLYQQKVRDTTCTNYQNTFITKKKTGKKLKNNTMCFFFTWTYNSTCVTQSFPCRSRSDVLCRTGAEPHAPVSFSFFGFPLQA